MHAHVREGVRFYVSRLRGRIESCLHGEKFRERLVQKLATPISVVQLLQFGKAFVTARTVINHITQASILYPMVKPFLRPSILMLDAW